MLNIALLAVALSVTAAPARTSPTPTVAAPTVLCAMPTANAPTASRRACTLNPAFTVRLTSGAATYTHDYTITSQSNGRFTGTGAGETASGSLVNNAFSFKATYSSGYTYTLNGTLDPSTGTITGTGTSSTNEQFNFTIENAATCTTDTDNGTVKSGCPAAPAVANAYLRTLGSRGRTNSGRIISAVARHMEQGARFDGLRPCDAGYDAAVRRYVDRQLARR